MSVCSGRGEADFGSLFHAENQEPSDQTIKEGLNELDEHDFDHDHEWSTTIGDLVGLLAWNVLVLIQNGFNIAGAITMIQNPFLGGELLFCWLILTTVNTE